MSKFNTSTARPAVGRGPVTAEPVPSGRTHKGGAGYAHDAKSELFLLAVANFVGGRVVFGVLFAALAVMNVVMTVYVRRRRAQFAQRSPGFADRDRR